MVYGTYNYSIPGAFVNQLTSLGGLTLYVWYMDVGQNGRPKWDHRC